MPTATLRPPTAAPVTARRPPRSVIVAFGLLAGASVGAVARGWMRMVTDDPEFTWSGTIFIVMAFTLAGLGHAVASAARRSPRRRWSTTGRFAGAILTLPLFGGAGAIMLPTVLFGALARWRVGWHPAVRGVLAALALLAPVAVAVDVVRAALTAERLAGMALFGATYWLVIHTAGGIAAPLDDGWRLPRWLGVALVVAVVLSIALVALALTGVQT
jgi:hypothetical protein